MIKANILNLVGIHATVLSIFAAVGFGYYAYLLRKRDELRFQIFNEADKINQITLPKHTILSTDKSDKDFNDMLRRLEIVNTTLNDPGFLEAMISNSEDRQVILDILKEIVDDSAKQKLDEGRYSNLKKEEIESFEIIKILSHLVTHYPFKKKAINTSEEETFLKFKDERLVFSCIEDVEKWLEKANYLYNKLDVRASTLRNSLDKSTQNLPGSDKSEEELAYIFDSLMDTFDELYELAESVRRKKRRWEIFKQKTNRPIIATISVTLIWLLFIFGIIYPLVVGDFFRWKLMVGIPLGAYGISLLGITISVFKGILLD